MQRKTGPPNIKKLLVTAKTKGARLIFSQTFANDKRSIDNNNNLL
mgnify:CR=1 FL=1